MTLLKRLRPAAAALLIAGLAACTSTDAVYYEDAPLTEKSITVPPGNGGIVGIFKSELRNRGWDIRVQRGPNVTRGTIGENTRLEQGATYRTRYTAYIDQRRYDSCVPSGSAYSFQISVVDNQDGSEVFAANGRGCEQNVRPRLQTEMNRF
ncbi:hypothetical protein CKO28_00720 [Rhodovibrio sodomensis]|uniref:Lipoprotein n=1 Tax=Rhodovibrio sodomensis TaxID=1088 RepID=A0ABS1D814_9PROT|nr:hypothetical protein [Rhodovibrio sodomensis]MBK1666564.1 hypothetical protein [Rhodovibrio sodomensis]